MITITLDCASHEKGQLQSFQEQQTKGRGCVAGMFVGTGKLSPKWQLWPWRTGSLEQSTGGKWKRTFWKDRSLGDYWEPHQLYKRGQLLGLDTLTSQIMGRKQVGNHLTAVLRARQTQGLIRDPYGRNSSVFLHRDTGKACVWGCDMRPRRS